MIGNREAINDSHLTSIPQAYSFVIGARGQQMLVIRTGRDAAHLMQMGHQSRNQQMCNQSRNQKMRNQGRNQQMLVFGTGREAPRLCPMSGGSQSMANQWPINGQSMASLTPALWDLRLVAVAEGVPLPPSSTMAVRRSQRLRRPSSAPE